MVFFRLRHEDIGPDGNTRNLLATLQYYLHKFKTHYLRAVTNIKLGGARGKFIILVDNSAFEGYGLYYPGFDIQDEFHLGSN